MKWLCRRLLDVVAAVLLLATLALLPFWISHAMPQRYWLQYYSVPVDQVRHRVRVGLGMTLIDVINVDWNERPIIGPKLYQPPMVNAFKGEFSLPTIEFEVPGLKIVNTPLFRTTADWHISMIGTERVFLVSYGLLIAVLAVVPAARWLPPLVRWVTRNITASPGCCVQCGYDLRATPERCPECGTVPLVASLSGLPDPSRAASG